MDIQSLITDLALILLLGAVTTVVFKWIKQPVVLGYIVAGFLASPNFEYLPSVANATNIDFWAQIGIVVLLFSLGLEFSFKKLISSGGSAVVTALIIVSGMMCVGFIVGYFLDLNSINSLFLGGMLSMSSTTIILKAFNDMGLRQKKFASLVLAVLVVEDLFAVLMMVILSSIAVNNSVGGSELLFSIAKLVFFLVIWVLVGVYVLPTLLNKIRRFLNSETLLVVSMGLCLGMAVFSVLCGFSLALGAFVMGSILAGTSYAERIVRVVAPVKDLFGAVFFISVGMMVQPSVLAQYWMPILVLSIVVILGMIIFGAFGMLVTGQSLKVAIQSGFSLTQIGEFAFIIANLGLSLGVLVPTLYPIVVAVSVITTFTTPYFIKLADPAYTFVERHLPSRLNFLINRYQKEAGEEDAAGRPWGRLIKRYAWRTMLYSIILIAIEMACEHYIEPKLLRLMPKWGGTVDLIITIGFMSPFLLALILPVRGLRRPDHTLYPGQAIPRIVLSIFRFILAVIFIVHAISNIYSAAAGIAVVVAIALLVVLMFSRHMHRSLRKIESTFMDNLNERELRRSGKKNAVLHDLHQGYIVVGNGSPFAGERLRNSNLRHKFGINITGIQRGTSYIPVPGADERLYPGDIVTVIGSDEQIGRLLPQLEQALPESETAADPSDAMLTSIMLSESSPLLSKTPGSAAMRDTYGAVVVAVDRGGEHIVSRPDLVFEKGDIVWLVGNPAKLSKLK